MCAPIALGAASLATGAVGAIGDYQSGQAQAAAANQAAANNYKYQLKVRSRNWDQQRHIYGQKISQFEEQVSENRLAAARGYAAAQRNMNEKFKQAAFSNESRLSRLVRSQGNFAAGDRAGKSADRLSMEQMMQFGRGRAAIGESLMSAQNNMIATNENIRRQELQANNKAYQQVAIRPQPGVAPVAPTMVPGPSGLSLAAGLLGAGSAGFNTYDQLTPGGAFGQRVD
mgnify:CR=1 FL=1|tara:strand:+ start:423 stop:1106 length:684 start_codon:yes stop_codon:yes gene_type:complete